MMFRVGVPFPKNYIATVKKIMTRLFRVFVHIYMHHFDKLVALGAVSSDNLYIILTSLAVNPSITQGEVYRLKAVIPSRTRSSLTESPHALHCGMLSNST